MMGDETGTNNENAFIAALDVGTTNVKCLIVDSNGTIVGNAYSKIKLYQPQPGWIEIHPDELYSCILDVIHRAVQDAKITLAMIKSLGISTHRATFITWEKDSGKYLHNFITWKDQRSQKLVDELNSSWRFYCFRGLCSLLHGVLRTDKFKLAKNYNISCVHVSSRLLWVLSNDEKVKQSLNNNNLMFGTLDTWLVYKFTNGRLHVTDFSNASATGFFDLFTGSWGFIPMFLQIPSKILPNVVDNDFSYGFTCKEIFGEPLQIGCLMADQMASMFGSGCFNNDDLKITIGTGAFLGVNTGSSIYPSLSNMYPLISWKLNSQLNYLLEIPCVESGFLINWLQVVGLVNHPEESAEMAFKVKDTNGIYILPDFDDQITDSDSAFIGVNSSTIQEHKVRAVLECIVYKIFISLQLLLVERNGNYHSIYVDGGIAKNDFICQLLADLSGVPINRMATTEMSSMGVIYISGLTSNIWRDTKAIQAMQKIQQIFLPTKNCQRKNEILLNFNKWLKIYSHNC